MQRYIFACSLKGQTFADNQKDAIATRTSTRLAKDQGATLLYVGKKTDVWSEDICGSAFAAAIGVRFPALSTSGVLPDGRHPGWKDPAQMAEAVWGHFVHIHSDRRSGDVTIYRDPSGYLPCFYTIENDTLLVFSDYSNLVDLGIERAIDWTFVTAHTYLPRLVSAKTGFRGVEQLLPGYSLWVRGGEVSSKQAWTPHRWAKNALTSDGASAEDLRKCIMDTVAAWASVYPKAVHNLSGGLDSSIVLNALAEAPLNEEVHCINFSDAGLSSDERPFARLVASHFNVPLTCFEVDETAHGLGEAAEVDPQPRPSMTGLTSALENCSLEHLRKTGSQAIFTGSGGDIVFFARKTHAYVLSDRLRRHGWRSALFHSAQSATLAKTSIWNQLHSVWQLRKQAKIEPLQRHASRSHSLTVQARDSIDEADLIHPWLNELKGVPVGKAYQIYGITDSTNYYTKPFSRKVPHINPLLSQPIVELCLSTPLYTLVPGVIDRELARVAFSHSLPTTVVRREYKGASAGYFSRVALRYKSALYDTLIGGNLVNRKILDPAKLEALFDETRFGANPRALLQALEYFGTEAWTRASTTPSRSNLFSR